jgi:hypothetical protein
MRLWSLHPSLLDRAGLVALWREALLAQKALTGTTKGYRNHPQLSRFRQSAIPRVPSQTICGVWPTKQKNAATISTSQRLRRHAECSPSRSPRDSLHTNSRISNRNFVSVTQSNFNWSINANQSRSIQLSRRWRGQWHLGSGHRRTVRDARQRESHSCRLKEWLTGITISHRCARIRRRDPKKRTSAEPPSSDRRSISTVFHDFPAASTRVWCLFGVYFYRALRRL